MDELKKLFSLKMRASHQGNHISGAERIILESDVQSFAVTMLERALRHSKGKPDFINLKLESVERTQIQYFDALPVSTWEASTPEDGLKIMCDQLRLLDASEPEKIIRELIEMPPMRGAALLNIDTFERMEPDKTRGVRVTYMDDELGAAKSRSNSKCHYAEAIVLASKVANAPHIVAELCISDDPDYVTGYFASKKNGYVRITCLKEPGCPRGGRIFLFRGTSSDAEETIAFLERQPVFIRNVQQLNWPTRLNPWQRLEEELIGLKNANLYRTTSVIESAQSRRVIRNGQEYLLFASNDYLDLAVEPSIKEATHRAVEKYGTGSGGSRLTTGTLPLHEELERELASFKETESAILFNSGYMANVGTISSLAKEGNVIFSDSLNHASIIDGCRLSRAKTIVYRHGDMSDLEVKIVANPCDSGLIVSDAVFSMDGDVVDLPALVTIAARYGLFSMIDEAHSTGVLGATGRGVIEHFGNKYKPDVIMGTLSKSLGSLGGFVCGRRLLTDYLQNVSRAYIFSTSLTPGDIASATAAIRYLLADPSRTHRLQRNIVDFNTALRERGILTRPSVSAIMPIPVGDELRALAASKALLDRGFIIPAIRYPTVARGSARLRVALMASHTKAELVALADALAEVLRFV